MTERAAWRSLLPSPRDYRDLRRTWRGDVLAGLTVGIVALPLALAFGVSSGAGAEAGLVTAIVAGVVAAVFGGSPVQVSGPTGAMVVVLAPIMVERGLGALAVVCLLAGAIVVLAGIARLGRLIGLIPWPVLEGFTVGIAIVIALQQVPAALGVSPAGHHTNAVIAAFQSLGETTWVRAWPALAIVLAVATVMILMPRITRVVPGSVIAIVLVSVAASAAGMDVATIGVLPSGLAAPSLPTVDVASVTSLLGPALAVAALAAIESLLSARVASVHSDTGPYDPDRELVGQGLASIASGLFGGMPATGAIARTAVNTRSGARTRLAAVVHAGVLLLLVSVASTVVGAIPLAALAGVLLVTAVTMIDGRTVRAIVKSSRADAVVFTVTAVITVAVDLIDAVAIGIAVAALFALRALARSAGVHREELPGAALPGDERIGLLCLDGALFFGAADRVLERAARIDGVRVVILRMSQVQLLDATGAQVLSELVVGLERRGVTVLVKGVQDRHQRLLEHAGVVAALGDADHVYSDLSAAVGRARELVAASPAG